MSSCQGTTVLMLFIYLFFPFFSPILWRWWIGNHPPENLAKFGYRSERKLYLFSNPALYLATYKNLWSKYGKFNFCFPQNMVTLGLFFLRKILWTSHNPFCFWSPSGKNPPQKKALVITCSFTLILSMAILISSY